MKTGKKVLSSAVVLGLMFFAAWCATSTTSWFMWPGPVCMTVMLLLESLVLFWVNRFRKGSLSVKNVVGVLCLVCLGIALAIGLYSAAFYLVAYLMGEHLGTSFPWYTVLFFVMIALGPVIAVTGIAWVVLHLRERKRNIRDIRLLTQLLLIGTAIWAVLWTVLRIRHILIYPHSYGYPWHASFMYAFIYFGPWLTFEGCALFLLRHWEKKLTPEDLAEVSASEELVNERKPVHWDMVARNGAVIIIPLVFAGVLMYCLWDTGYLAWNLAMALCSALNVCLMIGLSVWYLCYNQKLYTLGQLKTVVWILMALTVFAAVIWGFWYHGNCLPEFGFYAPNLVYTLGLVFFGPILLGGGIMLALMDRLPGVEVAEKKFPPLLVMALLAFLLVGQFTKMDYRDEIPVTVTKVTNYNPDTARPNSDESRVVVTFRTDYDVTYIYDSFQEERNDGIFLTFSTRWTPFRELKSASTSYTLYPEDDIEYIYVYEPGSGDRLVLIRDQFTGLWEPYE